jgi:hypothetical protein
MEVGSSGDLRGLQVGSTSGPKGIRSVGEPKVVRVWVRVWTQEVWGHRSVLGPKGVGGWVRSVVGLKGAGSVFQPKVVGVWVVAGPRGIGGRVGWGPKGVGGWVHVWIQRGWVHIQTQIGWDLGPSVSRPKGFGSFGIRTQGGWGIDPCPNPKELGFESFGDQIQGV